MTSPFLNEKIFIYNVGETFKEVSFNVDTYIDNECTKNEFGYFINENEINFYSVIDYTIKKKSKPLKVNPNMFFDL